MTKKIINHYQTVKNVLYDRFCDFVFFTTESKSIILRRSLYSYPCSQRLKSQILAYDFKRFVSLISQGLSVILNRSQHLVNCCINYFIQFFIVCFRHQCCCVFIRNKFNKITEGFFVFSLTYNIEYYTE